MIASDESATQLCVYHFGSLFFAVAIDRTACSVEMSESIMVEGSAAPRGSRLIIIELYSCETWISSFPRLCDHSCHRRCFFIEERDLDLVRPYMTETEYI